MTRRLSDQAQDWVVALGERRRYAEISQAEFEERTGGPGDGGPAPPSRHPLQGTRPRRSATIPCREPRIGADAVDAEPDRVRSSRPRAGTRARR